MHAKSKLAIRSSLVLAAAWFFVVNGGAWAAAQRVSIVEDRVALKQGTTHTLSVTYQSPGDGIVQLQLFSSTWKKIADASENIESGAGKSKLDIVVPAGTPIGKTYRWQALLYDRSWKKLAEVNFDGIEIVAGPGGPETDDPNTEQSVTHSVMAKDREPAKPGEPAVVTPSGKVEDPGPETEAKDVQQWVPPGLWTLDWADEFEGTGQPDKWFPMLGYNPDDFQKNDSKALRWSGSTAESAWMTSTKSGNHLLSGKGDLVMRIVCDKTETNEHGPKVNAAYLLSGYPDRWDSSEPNNAKWAGKFVSPADGPVYICASVRSDKVVGYSTWFAFWLFTETRAYNGNPTDGTEVDVVEIVEGKPEYMSQAFNVANHWKESGGSESKQFNAASRPRPEEYVDVNDTNYHVYGIEWSKDSMKCFVDGKLYYTFTENIPSDPVDMMMLLTLEFKPNAWDPNQGDGRTEGPFVSDTPKLREMSRVLVDYVRVFKKQE